jgi:hypothetical protein
MLKDLIKSGYENLLNKFVTQRYGEKFPFDLKGKLEVFGYRNGKLFHYDTNDNTITIWAKHAVMHLLTGEVFSSSGTSRSTASGDHVATGDTFVNNDGTMVSGEQYFGDPTFPGPNNWWSRPVSGDSLTHLYGFFPTKMLFGTGFEWSTWAEIGDSDYYEQYGSGGWNQTNFESNITDSGNTYSNDYSGDTLHKNKSMNDIYSTALSGTISDSSFGITGAVKDSLYNNSVGDSTNLEVTGGNYFAKKTYWGIGHPAFIYAKRIARFYQSGSEIALNFDSTVENKITFTITMPEQTGVNAGIFYPYNGFAIKEAGLFCDSRFRLKDTTPPNDAGSDDSGNTEFDNFSKMGHGIMFAKRYISPITKSHDVSITARWTIYL